MLREGHGFTAEDWHTVRLARRVDEPIPNAEMPRGFVVRHVAGEHEAPEYVALYREAMDSPTATVEWRLSVMREPEYDPELDLVAVAPDGTWAALCKGIIDREESARLSTVQGWTDPIGTRPAFRRLGLARALLLEGCRRLRERGVEVALIGTGSWNTATPSAVRGGRLPPTLPGALLQQARLTPFGRVTGRWWRYSSTLAAPGAGRECLADGRVRLLRDRGRHRGGEYRVPG